MEVKVGSARSDENGKLTGGISGDPVAILGGTDDFRKPGGDRRHIAFLVHRCD